MREKEDSTLFIFKYKYLYFITSIILAPYSVYIMSRNNWHWGNLWVASNFLLNRISNLFVMVLMTTILIIASYYIITQISKLTINKNIKNKNKPKFKYFSLAVCVLIFVRQFYETLGGLWGLNDEGVFVLALFWRDVIITSVWHLFGMIIAWCISNKIFGNGLKK